MFGFKENNLDHDWHPIWRLIVQPYWQAEKLLVLLASLYFSMICIQKMFEYYSAIKQELDSETPPQRALRKDATESDVVPRTPIKPIEIQVEPAMAQLPPPLLSGSVPAVKAAAEAIEERMIRKKKNALKELTGSEKS